jgi:hypothetical protein
MVPGDVGKEDHIPSVIDHLKGHSVCDARFNAILVTLATTMHQSRPEQGWSNPVAEYTA